MASPVVRIDQPADLDPRTVVAVAGGARLELSPALLERLAGSRDRTVAALAATGPVYGVTTGMGSQSGLAVGSSDQPSFQGDLMLARAVGTAPWLDLRSARAAVATRLRTLLDEETGASPALARSLVDLLGTDLHPAVPATGNGAAGEIIPLAHLGGFLTGLGEGVAAGDGARRRAAARGRPHAVRLRGQGGGWRSSRACRWPPPRAVLLGADARLLASQALAVAAGELALDPRPA